MKTEYKICLAIGFTLFFLWLGTDPSFERLLFAHLVITIPYMCRMLQKLQLRVQPREVSITSTLRFMMW